MESDGSDIEVVISNNELEVLRKEGSSDANSFIASSSSSDGDEDADSSKDEEYGSARPDKASDDDED